MFKYKFVIVSKDSNTLLTKNDFKNFENIDVEYILNNSTSLTQIYNRQLHQARQKITTDVFYDYLIFIHADARLNLAHLLEHIESVHGKYAIMGLCGTEYVNVSESPLNWFTSSNQRPNARWGSVTHIEINNKTSYFSYDRPNILDHEVGCIDGVCIIFSKEALQSGISFDETFKFDQYDTDLSLQCVMNYKMKLGVLVEQSLVHASVGKSITTNEFLIHELDLRRKWKFDIPPNSKLELLLKQIQQLQLQCQK